MIWVIVGIVWFACGLWSYGASLAYYQGKYRLIAEEGAFMDVKFCMAMSLAGPFSLLAMATVGAYGYGFMLWPDSLRKK